MRCAFNLALGALLLALGLQTVVSNNPFGRVLAPSAQFRRLRQDP